MMRPLLRVLCSWWVAAALVGCGYDDFDLPSVTDEALPVPNMSIATLRARCATERVVVADEGVVLGGYVVSSDRAGNFFRSLVVEDNTGAVEVMVGLYDLYNSYPVGSRVAVKADGLCGACDEGMLRLGLKGAVSGEPVAYMASRLLVDRHLFLSSERIVPTPLPLGLPVVDEKHLGSLVRIAGVQLTPMADTTWADPSTDPPRSRMLKFRIPDRVDSIWVFTSGYATFADQKVPKGRVSLTGILQSAKVNGHKTYQIRLRDANDVQTD